MKPRVKFFNGIGWVAGWPDGRWWAYGIWGAAISQALAWWRLIGLRSQEQ